MRKKRYNSTPRLLFTVLLLSALPACSQLRPAAVKRPDTANRKWDQTIPGNFSGQTQATFDSTQLTVFLNRYPAFKSYTKAIRTFYSHRNYAYAWFESGRLIEQASNLANRVLNFQHEGLTQHPPYQAKLDSLMFAEEPINKRADTELELMLTAQYFAFSSLAWTGQGVAVSRSLNWNLPRKKVDYEKYLDSLLHARSADFASGEPVYRQYELLRKYLISYHTLANEDWPVIGVPVTLKAGDTSAVIKAVKARLFKLADFQGDTTGRQYDDDLLNAVRRFQGRHGPTVNGALNKETLTELNVPVQQRVQQLMVNMERSRWLQVRLSGDYLAVNIPEFKLHVYHADSLLWSCNVVVGQTMHRTSIFYGEVKYVVFRPYWNIPAGILRKEVLPAMRRDPGYLAAHHMEITGYRNGLPVIRQRPGPDNSLGLVKFLFPNSYNIYLHDTPSKSLFGETSRAFSHGCIRVSEPARLAGFLLKDREAWTPQRMEQEMNKGPEKVITLKQTVPVFIAYFTAFVDRNNQLNFRKDIYGFDGPLAEALTTSDPVVK
jgi:murein L,D-transpeptidase YcbB/YkuD